MARQEAEQQQDTRATRSEESARAAVVALSQDVSQLKQLVQQKEMELQAMRATESPRSQDRQRLASSLAAQHVDLNAGDHYSTSRPRVQCHSLPRCSSTWRWRSRRRQLVGPGGHYSKDSAVGCLGQGGLPSTLACRKLAPHAEALEMNGVSAPAFWCVAVRACAWMCAWVRVRWYW